jgi:hypothetical protein
MTPPPFPLCADWRSARARQAAAYGQGSSEGYGDNLDCGVRIRGKKGSTVNLHIVSMNIEGDGNGICNEDNEQYIGHSCNTNGGDFLEIYDGTSADAPLLGRINGQPTDAVLARDSFTTPGRDMYVHFTTDSGNYGLTNSGATPPGFYAEWQIIKEGGECVNFEARPGMALVGHNNEQLVGMTVAQCTAACCARNWCKSFDYIQQSQTCNLADVDSNTQFGTTTQNRYDTLYQRPVRPRAPKLSAPRVAAAGQLGRSKGSCSLRVRAHASNWIPLDDARPPRDSIDHHAVFRTAPTGGRVPQPVGRGPTPRDFDHAVSTLATLGHVSPPPSPLAGRLDYAGSRRTRRRLPHEALPDLRRRALIPSTLSRATQKLRAIVRVSPLAESRKRRDGLTVRRRG